MKRGRKKLFREILPEENIDTYLDYIQSICRIKKNKNGKCRRVCGSNKTLIYYARLKWNIKNPGDPVLPGDGYDIDHDDGDSMNDDITNYVKRTHGEHTRRHNKGKKLSPDHIRKITESMMGKKQSPESIRKSAEGHMKKVVANFIIYNSRKEAAKALGVVPQTIRNRILANKPGYYYINKEEK